MFKTIIGPLIVGILFYTFIFLGLNFELISNNSILTWVAIIGGTILLYIICFGILKSPKKNTLGVLGVVIAKVLISIGVPMFLIFSELYSPPKTIEEKPHSLLEKDKIKFESISHQCNRIKYGKFSNGIDTIIRYRENDKDFELVKSFNKEKNNRIKWLDSCSYIRIDERNNSISRYVRLGNFKNSSHQMYSKPSISHKMEDEKMETVFELKE